MDGFWDDDWGYRLSLWVETEKKFSEFTAALQEILGTAIVDNRVTIGGIACDIATLDQSVIAPTYEGIPERNYPYVIHVPVGTDLIWSAIDKPFAIGLMLSMKHRFQCNVLAIADDDFFVGFSGSNQPFFINIKYKPWSYELSAFTRGQRKVEVSFL